MQMQGQVLAGSTQTIATKKGEQLQKSRLKVMDIGPEAVGGDVYYVDLWGEHALSDDEWRSVLRQQVTLEIRRVSASAGKASAQTGGPLSGRVYLNLSGGALTLNGQVVQRALRSQQGQPGQQATQQRGA
jgi:hypothetical protein